ncbi:MAG: NAD(P)/FAD-dependent oxidoreductase [Desulfobacteraceae bacterium]|nr:NAD(P)/FAD-dependent oxidoreductase [Desulfobacteraceae bacterium]
MKLHRVVIVGGGVGGLELAIRLGRKASKKKTFSVLLIDRNMTHLWKPLLHEVAAGTLDSHEEAVDYLALARRNGFQFRPGKVIGLQRTPKTIRLSAVVDAKGGTVLPAEDIAYDTLVLALGSESNDYGIPGVKEHCFFLDGREQADQFHAMLLNKFMQLLYTIAPSSHQRPTLRVAIVGAGATGVELAAELHNVASRIKGFGLEPYGEYEPVHITLIEAAPRILAALPAKLATAAEKQLKKINIEMLTSSKVQTITAEGVLLSDGRLVPAHLKVWAAGIKAPDFFGQLEGLEVNRLNQLQVRQNLCTTKDPDIFAIGDCASCPQPNSDLPVPPRAQSAHQQAAVLAQSIVRRIDGGTPVDYVYKDYGSLVSLSRSFVGNLMGNLTGSHFIEGWLARVIYLSLYRSHQWVLHGSYRTLILMLMDTLARRVKPRLKLH